MQSVLRPFSEIHAGRTATKLASVDALLLVMPVEKKKGGMFP